MPRRVVPPDNAGLGIPGADPGSIGIPQGGNPQGGSTKDRNAEPPKGEGKTDGGQPANQTVAVARG